MRIKCSKSSLLAGINIVSKAVSTKTTMTILECILIEVRAGKIKLMANDLSIGIETYIDGEILEEGKIAIEAKLFSDIIRKLSDSEVDIETNSDYRTIIKCEKAKFTISSKSGDDFSSIPIIEKEKSITLSQLALKELIRQTIFSISDNENTKLMTGESFEVKDNVLIVVSLDGHRISMRKLKLKGENEDVKVVVPGKTLIELNKILNGGADDEISIFFSDNNILFEFGDTRVVSRLLEGEYYKISQMLSIGHKMSILVNRTDFLGSIDRASILIHDSDKKPIILSIKDDNNMFLKVDSNMGNHNEEIDIKKTGGEIVVGFNPKFLMDALRVIDDDNITIFMNDSKSPCIIKNEEETYVYVILPVNINAAAY